MKELFIPQFLVVQARLDPEAIREEQGMVTNIASQAGDVMMRYHNALDRKFPADEISERLETFDGIILLGSSNVNLTDKTDLADRYHSNVDPVAKHALQQGTAGTNPKPALGICLGAQELHYVAGAKIITDNKQAEGGTTDVWLTEQGLTDPLFEGIPLRTRRTTNKQGFKMIFAHNQVAELAEGFVVLGSTDRHVNSITRKGEVVTVQGHPEDIQTTRLDRALAKALYPMTYKPESAPFAQKTIVNFLTRARRLSRLRNQAVYSR